MSRGFPQGGGAPSAEPPSAPGVILKGIYRFGDTYHVSLQSGGSGTVQTVTWQPGQGDAPVFDGYQIQVVDTRNVTLALPPGVSCQSNSQFGGSCVGRNQMSVTFAQTEPTRRTQQRNNNNNNRNNNRNDDRAPWDRNTNNNQWFNTQGGGVDIRALIESGADRQQIEAMIRERTGRGNNNNANTGGRGRGGASDNNAGNTTGRGGGAGNTTGRGGGGGNTGRGGGGGRGGGFGQ